MRKRSNSTGILNKKKTGNTATASLKRSNSVSSLLKRRKPLITLQKGMVRKMLPSKLANSISGNVRKNAFMIESPDKSYDSLYWRDNDGPKMFLSIEQNNGTETSDSILNDLEQVLNNKDQTILSQDNKLPTTLIINTSRNNADDAVELAKQIVVDHNAQNSEGKHYKIDQIQQKELDNNTVGLTISITEANLNQPRQGEFDDIDTVETINLRENYNYDDDLDSEDFIIQPKNFQNDDNLVEQELVIQASSDDSSQDDTFEQETRLQRNVDQPLVMSVEQFKKETKESRFSRDRDRTTEYNNLIASLEAYHKDYKQNYKKIIKDYETEANLAKEKITKIGEERSKLIKEVVNLKKEIDDNEKDILTQQGILERKTSNLNLFIEKLKNLNETRVNLNQPTDEQSRIKNEQKLGENEKEIERTKEFIKSTKKDIKKESLQLMISMINSSNEIEELNKEIDAKNIEIEKVDDTLKKEIKKTEDAIHEYSNQFNGAKENVIKAAKNYLDSKKLARKDDKIKAVESLINQASDPTLLKELSKQVYNIDFNHQLLSPIKILNTGTASEVFLVETKGNIENSKTNKGYAKKAIKKDDKFNAATQNLGIPINSDTGKLEMTPSLIARQVTAYRVAKAFDSKLIAPEVFSADFDGTTFGVTAQIENATQAMKNVINDGIGIQEYTRFDFSKPKTQKDFADLQIMDAINGQLDRHLGNVFIDKETGDVVTIDQDQSHPLRSEEQPVRTGDHSLNDQFAYNKEGKLVYNQTQVDANTAKKIIAMTPENLRKILEGNPDDPEKLDKEAIDHTIERFIAVKEQVIKLKKERKLISKWNAKTFKKSLEIGVVDGDQFSHKNYITRAVKEFETAATDPRMRQVF